MDDFQKQIKEFLEKYWKADISDAIVERAYDLLDELLEGEVVCCPVCGRLYLENENALQYTDTNGNRACDCQSPENVATSRADMEYDFSKEE